MPFDWKLWLKQFAAAFAGWSLLAMLYALQQVRLARIVEDRHLAFWTVLWPGFTTYWVCALLTPPVIAFARWMEFQRDRLGRFVAAHLFGFLAFVGLQATLRLALFPLHNARTGGVYPRSLPVLRNLFLFYFNDDIFIYFPIVGITLAYTVYRQNRERELAEAKLHRQLAGAELQILKMQLHPHFLFNTLQAISTLVGKDPVAARRMIALLGDLLRAVIDRPGEQEVPLRDELDLLDRYVQIELVRFGDWLAVGLEIAEETLEIQVPSLLLQPVVENAIRHGARAAKGRGEIRISGMLREGRLILEVMDNGPGLPPPENRNPGGLGW